MLVEISTWSVNVAVWRSTLKSVFKLRGAFVFVICCFGLFHVLSSHFFFLSIHSIFAIPKMNGSTSYLFFFSIIYSLSSNSTLHISE